MAFISNPSYQLSFPSNHLPCNNDFILLFSIQLFCIVMSLEQVKKDFLIFIY